MITELRLRTKTIVDVHTNLDLSRSEVAKGEHLINLAVTPDIIAKFGSDIRVNILRSDFPHHGNIVRLEYASSFVPTKDDINQLLHGCIPE